MNVDLNGLDIDVSISALKTLIEETAPVFRISVVYESGCSPVAKVSFYSEDDANAAMSALSGRYRVSKNTCEDELVSARKSEARWKRELIDFKRYLAWYIDCGRRQYEKEGSIAAVAAAFKAAAEEAVEQGADSSSSSAAAAAAVDGCASSSSAAAAAAVDVCASSSSAAAAAAVDVCASSSSAAAAAAVDGCASSAASAASSL
jgi:hypothetical protein